MIWLSLIFVIPVLIWTLASYASGCDPWFMFRRKVYFRYYDGRIGSEGREHQNGCAYLYGSTMTGLMTIKEDGTTTGLSFITYWSYDPTTLKEI